MYVGAILNPLAFKNPASNGHRCARFDHIGGSWNAIWSAIAAAALEIIAELPALTGRATPLARNGERSRK
jgi:hypothetical protein